MSRSLQTGSLYIVSEGEKTEASFYTDLQQKLSEKNISRFQTVQVHKLPKPKDQTDKLPDSELRTEGGRQLHGAVPVLPIDNYQPLNWIKIAYEKLGAYDEAWALFDNDHRNTQGQPFIDRAIAEYHKLITRTGSNLNLNIAYSSLSFEYYLLLHFEQLYHSFDKTECYWVENNEHKYRNCCSQDVKYPPKEGACDGHLENACCINGYARLRNYWDKSKKDGVLSKMPNVYIGIIHACRIRWQAIQSQRGTTLGDMNPYLNTYQFTLRMMGLPLLEYDEDIVISNKTGNIILRLECNSVHIFNQSNKSLLLSEQYLSVFSADTIDLLGLTKVGNLARCLIPIQQDDYIDISSLAGTNHFALFDIEGHKIMVIYIPSPSPDMTPEEKEKIKLVNAEYSKRPFLTSCQIP